MVTQINCCPVCRVRIERAGPDIDRFGNSKLRVVRRKSVDCHFLRQTHRKPFPVGFFGRNDNTARQCGRARSNTQPHAA